MVCTVLEVLCETHGWLILEFDLKNKKYVFEAGHTTSFIFIDQIDEKNNKSVKNGLNFIDYIE